MTEQEKKGLNERFDKEFKIGFDYCLKVNDIIKFIHSEIEQAKKRASRELAERIKKIYWYFPQRKVDSVVDQALSELEKETL